MKKYIVLLISLFMVLLTACGGGNGSVSSENSTLDKIVEKKKLVIGTAPGYLPFDMKDKKGNYVGYDMDLARAIGKSLNVEVEFKQYEFSGLIPALQTGDIDIVLAGMTMRGDRALSVGFSNPYYSTGQALMVPTGDSTTTNYQQLDQAGKTIAVAQGTTGALLAKQVFKKAKVVDYPDFPSAGMAMTQGEADGIVYDEPAIKIFINMNPSKVKQVSGLISSENLGIAVKSNDFKMIQWLNSFLYSYRNSPDDIASINKWFKSTDWMNQVDQKK
ncbi:transporter substrate-binding domain-containing protein [Shimazuella kribbensis]|uniref:transporter substrate-binding domain-containing protein n=1 Tax=Shimazuella kribbensis TaxID=139808 RepID=UPI0003F9E9C0|nr:transporter substrate-binding domain-containing protein [Shimazuella kribbensis]